MRIKLPKSGDERVITKFLWFPKTIDRECRWLERASYKQVFKVVPDWEFLNFNHWEDWEWINK